MFLGQYVSKLTQETMAYLRLSYEGLAHEMSIPELVLRDAGAGTRVELNGMDNRPTQDSRKSKERVCKMEMGYDGDVVSRSRATAGWWVDPVGRCGHS